MTTLNLQVDANSDDARVDDTDPPNGTWNGVQNLTAFHLVGRSGDGYGEGLRFLNVTIAQGLTINSATLTWTARTNQAGTDVLTNIDGEDADDTATFTAVLANYTDRPRTTALVPWDNLGAWTTDTEYESPELKTILQEIVDRGSWSSGNAAVFFWENDGSSDGALRTDYSHDGAPTKAAKLDIDYGAAGVTVTPTTLALILTEFVPTVSAPRLVTPTTLALVLSEFAPTVSTPRLVTPTTLALVLTEFVPTVSVGAAIEVTPGTLAQTLAFFAPTITPSTYVTYGAPFLYTAANWGGSLAFYLEVYIKAATGTARARLWNDTDGAVVANSGLNTAATSYTRLRSGALSLTGGKTYVVQFGTEDGTAGEFKHGKVIAL